MKNTTTKKYMNGINADPIARPYLLHMLCGIISPIITIMKVETARPTSPEVKSAMRIERAELTAIFPRRIVLSNKLPLLLNGNILLAYFASCSSHSLSKGPIVRSSK